MFSSDSEDRRRIMFIVLVRATFVAPGVFVPEKQQKSLRSVVGCWPGNDWHAEADQCPIQIQMSLEMELNFFLPKTYECWFLGYLCTTMDFFLNTKTNNLLVYNSSGRILHMTVILFKYSFPSSLSLT